jgi:hypothetical protein
VCLAEDDAAEDLAGSGAPVGPDGGHDSGQQRVVEAQAVHGIALDQALRMTQL